MTNSAPAAIFALTAGLVVLMLFLGLLIPDTTPQTVRERKVYRMPQGVQRTSSKHWSWQNDTVLGLFRVFTSEDATHAAASSKIARHKRAKATACCSTIKASNREVRLYEAEGYEIEAANDGSFSSSAMISVFSTAASTWESIVGNRFGAQTVVSNSAGLVFNGKNQVGLGALDVAEPNALAVTGLWLVCPAGGSISACTTKLKIGEWDQTYAITEHDWSVSGQSSAFDLVSVAVHEFGHNVGLDDLTSESCWSSTMYGYSSAGETHRRSLDANTKKCAQDLYGVSAASSDWRGPALMLAATLMLLL